MVHIIRIAVYEDLRISGQFYLSWFCKDEQLYEFIQNDSEIELLPYSKNILLAHVTQLFPLLEQKIRIFGTAKENHGFRYTQMYGKARMKMKVALTFACMNLKKLAKMQQSWELRTVPVDTLYLLVLSVNEGIFVPIHEIRTEENLVVRKINSVNNRQD